MPRKGPATRREIIPDPKYHDMSVSKFANMLMLDGEKGKVEKIIYGAMELIQQRTGEEALEFLSVH
jgi:small subunit ribosomal protein S7